MKRLILLIICLCVCIGLIFGITYTSRQYVTRLTDEMPSFNALLVDLKDTINSFDFTDIFEDGYQFGDIFSAVKVFVVGIFQVLLVPVKFIQFLFEFIWAVLPIPTTL